MKQMLLLTQLATAALVAVSFAAACSSTSLPTAGTSVTTPTESPAPTTTVVTTDGTCATGDGVNDACSCDADAQTYCAGFYGADWQAYAKAHGYTTASWKYGLLDCLSKNPTSDACQASRARREVLNEQMMDACVTYCRGTSPQPGAEPCVDRLKSLYDSLNTTCRAALDAHEAAKPLDTHGPL